MVRTFMLIGSVVTGIAFAVPVVHEANPRLLPGIAKSVVGSDKIEEIPALAMLATDPEKISTSHNVRLAPDDSGHFKSKFRINGRLLEAMVDTGASVVAINLSTARRIGVSVSSNDFTRQVNTANGVIHAAPVTLSKVEIGGIAVRDVEAVVLEDKALSGTLIGVSFLQGVKRYRVQDGDLFLEQ